MHRHFPSIFTAMVLILFTATFFMGCGDKCKRVVCVNGTCEDGICNCNTGYFKEDCNSIINAGFDGTWELTEECTAGSDYYSVSVRPAAGSKTALDMVGIFEQSDDTLVAEVGTDGMEITVPRQSLGIYEVSATGQANEDQAEITLEYQVFQPGQSQSFDQCTATLTKN
jgi:hypothetical protein